MFKPDLEPDQCVACYLPQGRCCKALGRDAKGFRLLANNAHPVLQGKVRMLWRAKVMETAGLLKHIETWCSCYIAVSWSESYTVTKASTIRQHVEDSIQCPMVDQLHLSCTMRHSQSQVPSPWFPQFPGCLQPFFWCTGLPYIRWWSIAGGTSENSPFQATCCPRAEASGGTTGQKDPKVRGPCQLVPWDSTGPDNGQIGCKIQAGGVWNHPTFWVCTKCITPSISSPARHVDSQWWRKGGLGERIDARRFQTFSCNLQMSCVHTWDFLEWWSPVDFVNGIWWSYRLSRHMAFLLFRASSLATLTLAKVTMPRLKRHVAPGNERCSQMCSSALEATTGSLEDGKHHFAVLGSYLKNPSSYSVKLWLEKNANPYLFWARSFLMNPTWIVSTAEQLDAPVISCRCWSAWATGSAFVPENWSWTGDQVAVTSCLAWLVQREAVVGTSL